MKQILIISGKGGTGKTSITGAFASLQQDAVFCDCDVDASDLHLLLKPEKIESKPFISGIEAEILEDKCIKCGRCYELCRFNAIKEKKNSYYVEDISCEGCGVCQWNCPVGAIVLNDCLCGTSSISSTRFGMMSHAKLKAGAENSGKLVAHVREQARKVAKENNKSMIIIDGPPGIGCPVIASITGVDAVLIVAEPSQSSFHDLLRVIDLAKEFELKPFICINKCDVNEEITTLIENKCKELQLEIIGKIPYNKSFTRAQVEGKTIIEYQDEKITPIIKDMWNIIKENIKE